MASLGATAIKNLGEYLGRNATPAGLVHNLVRFSKSYQARYVNVKGAKMTPFWHLVFLGIGINYAIEYPHLKHSQHRKYH